MAKRFEKALDIATDQTLVEPNWEGILECVDMIRGSDVSVKDAILLIQKRYHSINPHIAHHALLVLEACVKNCGKKFHVEIATKDFMDDLKNLVIAGTADKVKEKILELVQCWSSAFKNKTEYKIVVDTHNLLKMNGFEFPIMREADAMFMADSAPDWVEGNNCYRCRSDFGVFTRKHHCRACGQIFCDKCSNKQMFLPQFGIEKKVRVCEACYEKKVKQKETKSLKKDDNVEQARIQELVDKETEELQLALAISQSEAEEQERLSHNYSIYGNCEVGTSNVNAKSEDKLEDFKNSNLINKEKNLLKNEIIETPLDSVLAKYLDRDYWEQKRLSKKSDGLLPKATAPPPSEVSVSLSSNTSHFLPNETLNVYDPQINTENIINSINKIQLNNYQVGRTEEDEIAETSNFCKLLKEQVDTMDNRMRSNLLRGRLIINDSAIHSLFVQLTNSHVNVLARMTKLESEREYYESLQDHLAHIQEARQAVNALREEHLRQKEVRLLEEQQKRRIQMQQKLEYMRQKKHEMLIYQRHIALQRFQKQEQQIQKRRLMQQQPQQNLIANKNNTISSTTGFFTPYNINSNSSDNTYVNNEGLQPSIMSHQQFYPQTIPSSVSNQKIYTPTYNLYDNFSQSTYDNLHENTTQITSQQQNFAKNNIGLQQNPANTVIENYAKLPLTSYGYLPIQNYSQNSMYNQNFDLQTQQFKGSSLQQQYCVSETSTQQKNCYVADNSNLQQAHVVNHQQQLNNTENKNNVNVAEDLLISFD